MRSEPPTVVLNSNLIRALMLGAGIAYAKDLAGALGIAPSTLSRALDGKHEPSVGMIDGLSKLWDKVPYGRLFVAPGDVDPPETYGLRLADLDELSMFVRARLTEEPGYDPAADPDDRARRMLAVRWADHADYDEEWRP